MLIPELKAVLFLFSYPDPVEVTVILSTTVFFLTGLINCFPIPNEVNSTVLIPERASFWVGKSLALVNPTLETKYVESVLNPPTFFWPSFFYTTSSKLLNLWYVPNPIS